MHIPKNAGPAVYVKVGDRWERHEMGPITPVERPKPPLSHQAALHQIVALLRINQVKEALAIARAAVVSKYEDEWPLPEKAQRYVVDRIVMHGKNECWRWRGAHDSHGYGKADAGSLGKSYSAHKVAYMTFVGPVPFGHQLDHLCGNRWCCRPSHLEPVTPETNVRRGVDRAMAECARPLKYRPD